MFPIKAVTTWAAPPSRPSTVRYRPKGSLTASNIHTRWVCERLEQRRLLSSGLTVQWTVDTIDYSNGPPTTTSASFQSAIVYADRSDGNPQPLPAYAAGGTLGVDPFQALPDLDPAWGFTAVANSVQSSYPPTGPQINVQSVGEIAIGTFPISGNVFYNPGTVTFTEADANQGGADIGTFNIPGDLAYAAANGASTVTITGSFDLPFPGSPLKPDLSGSFTGALPASAARGSVLSPMLVITNHGATVSGSQQTEFFLSTSPNLDGILQPPVFIDTPDVVLADGASYTDPAAFLVPQSVSAGTYYLVAHINATGSITEADSANNVVSSGPIEITDATPPSTLVPTLGTTTLPSTVIGGAAVHGKVTFNLINQGGTLTKGSATMRVYASTSGVVDSAATLVATMMRHVSIKPSGTLAFPVVITSLPTTLADGTYTLLAQVTDPSGKVGTSTTGPTVRVAQPFIDLSAVFASPLLITSGLVSTKMTAVSVSLMNHGNVSAGGLATLTLYTSVSGQLDGGQTALPGFKPIPLRLKPGKSTTIRLRLKLPTGTYFLVGMLDDPSLSPTDSQANDKIFATQAAIQVR